MKNAETELLQTDPEFLHLLRQSDMLAIQFGSHLGSAVTKVAPN